MKNTPVTAENKVWAIKNRVRKIAIEMRPDLVGTLSGDAFIGQLLGLKEFAHYRVDLTMAEKETVFKIFLDACAFVPDIKRLAKDAVPAPAIMKRLRQEHAEMVAANRRAINRIAAVSGLA